MKKKSTPKPKMMTADDHRKLADKHHAKGRLHEAKAEMLDVDNPPKRDKYGVKTIRRPY